MTPTSGKRREVAEMLRGAAHRHDAVECGLVTNVLGLEYGIYESVVAFPSDAVSRLADLIDPTCGDEAGGDDALAVEALEYIYALESALVHLSAEDEREKIVSLMCAVRDRFAPNLSEKLYDWTKGVMVDD